MLGVPCSLLEKKLVRVFHGGDRRTVSRHPKLLHSTLFLTLRSRFTPLPSIAGCLMLSHQTGRYRTLKPIGTSLYEMRKAGNPRSELESALPLDHMVQLSPGPRDGEVKWTSDASLHTVEPYHWTTVHS
jgi:hypothetical protein